MPDGQVNPHTPLHIVLMTPITALRYADARVVWLIANALMFALAFGWFARSNGTSRWFAAMVGLASLLIPTVYRHLQLGQSHAVLLLLFVGAWRALKRDRDAGAGIALGLATALRVIPLVLLLPLLRQRRFRAAAWHAGSALAFTVVGVGLAGGTSLGDFLRTAGGDNVSFWRSAPMNSSLSALPYRWLTENPWGYGIANLPALAAVAGALLTLAALVAAWRSPARGTSDLFWATVPWMLLASPLFWEHYLVLAIPAAALALRTRLRSSGIATKLAMIAGALVLLGEPPGLSGLVSGISAPEQLLGYALPLYSMLVLGLSDWLAQPARSSVTPAAETTSA